MPIIFTRAVILYVALLVVMRLMGKRQIGEMQPFEFIITLLIAELACVPMTDVSIPLSYGLISVLAVFILHQIMSIVERSGKTVKFLISGKPSVVLTPNGVDMHELKKNNMGVEDLIEAMRAQGYFSLDDLSYAIFESNGKLSALENPDRNTRPSMPILLINDGKIIKGNFEQCGLTLENLKEKTGGLISDPKKTEILTIDEYGRMYVQNRNEKYKVLKPREENND